MKAEVKILWWRYTCGLKMMKPFGRMAALFPIFMCLFLLGFLIFEECSLLLDETTWKSAIIYVFPCLMIFVLAMMVRILKKMASDPHLICQNLDQNDLDNAILNKIKDENERERFMMSIKERKALTDELQDVLNMKEGSGQGRRKM